ncbi:MAG TPA: DUF3108 domain-containing protein, partial [Candidatus Polarisedimenticolia bacterium]|nr:DUF3108 domain-containing protein [Candidatus Polarisedimenticolia bacterium]
MALVLLIAPHGAAAHEPDRIPDPPARAIRTEPLEAAQHAAADGGEVVRLHWRLSGFLGLIAGLFVPRTGDALLTFVPLPDDRVRIEFLVTSPRREGEYYLYGAEVDRRSGSPFVIWNSQKIKDRRKDSEANIDDPQTIDYASAIYRLRWHGPDEASAMTIWDRGRSYPAQVIPLGVDTRSINGTEMQVRGYEIRGADGGEGTSFDDTIWLYFAQDDRSTPVEIVGKRGLIRARIELVGV